MGARWRAPAGLHVASARLPVEGELPSLDGATGWLNSEPLAHFRLSSLARLTSPSSSGWLQGLRLQSTDTPLAKGNCCRAGWPLRSNHGDTDPPLARARRAKDGDRARREP